MIKQLSERYGHQIYRFLLWITTLIAILAVGIMVSRYFRTQEYATFTRPDGDYRVVVVRISTWRAFMPGQAGDAPGVIRLYNRHGTLLHETKVEMVQLVDQVEWGEKKVRIKLVAEWDLPD